MQFPSLENVSINTLERVFEEFYRSPFVCGYNQIIISSLLSNRILASVYRSIERKHEYSLWDLFKTFLKYWPHEQKWACGMWYSPWKTRPQRMRKGIAIFVWKQHNQKDRGVRGSLLRPNLEKGWLPISFPTREVFGDNLRLKEVLDDAIKKQIKGTDGLHGSQPLREWSDPVMMCVQQWWEQSRLAGRSLATCICA